MESAENADRSKAETKLREYQTGTQRRALLVGLTLGTMVSLAGVRLLGPIFEVDDGWKPFQQALFHFTDVILTAGLIAGGSATIHELMATVDTFLKESRKQAKGKR